MNRMYGLGLLTGFALGTLFYLCQVLFDASNASRKGVEPPRFEVVDTYKGCDVVRWSDDNMATYKYFLHCDQ